MIKILHLSYCDKNTGAGIAAYRIHKSICNHKQSEIKSFLRINTLCSDNLNTIATKNKITIFYNFFKKYFERILIKIFKYDDKVFHSISILPSLKHREINKLDIDLVHIHWVQHETISIEEIGKIKFPIVWTLHDCWPFSATEHYQKNNLDQRYKIGYKVKNLFRISEYIDKLCFYRKKFNWKNDISLIAPSKWIANCARNSLIMKDKQIVVIPNPLDTNVFKTRNKRSARKSLKLKNNKKVLLFGSIDGGEDPRKGADLLIDLLKFITFKKENIQIVIFGKTNKSQDIFKDCNFEIINVGKINSNIRMSILYSAADIFIMPSRIESFGQTAAEAQSCGTPVVGFDIGGLKDIVENNKNGILIEPYKVKKMAFAIDDLLSNEEVLQRLSYASRENAINNWHHKKVARSHINFYKNILNYE